MAKESFHWHVAWVPGYRPQASTGDPVCFGRQKRAQLGFERVVGNGGACMLVSRRFPSPTGSWDQWFTLQGHTK